MDVAAEGGKPCDVLYMRFFVEDRLIQVGDAPALGNVEGAAGTPPFWSVYPEYKTEAHAEVHYEKETVRAITFLDYSVSEDKI